MTGLMVDRSPRPVFCVIDHACRDLQVAESVVSGRFTHVGLTLQLGVEPDWLGAEFPTDKEWRIEWSKFYFGLNLANAFADEFIFDVFLAPDWIEFAIGHRAGGFDGQPIQGFRFA